MEFLTPWHLVLILLGFVLLFGYKRLPDASRSVGRSLRIFKAEVRELSDGSDTASAPPETGSAAVLAGTPSADELETQAAQAEAEAAALRARARGQSAES